MVPSSIFSRPSLWWVGLTHVLTHLENLQQICQGQSLGESTGTDEGTLMVELGLVQDRILQADTWGFDDFLRWS